MMMMLNRPMSALDCFSLLCNDYMCQSSISSGSDLTSKIRYVRKQSSASVSVTEDTIFEGNHYFSR